MIKKILGIKKSYKHTVAICCIVKDENSYLPEFIDYHLKTGVSHFYIYDNESAIAVTETLKSYVDNQIVTIERVVGKGIQLEVYRQCLDHYGAICQWIAFIDADEFIVPKTLTGNLPEFLKPYEPYAALGINWLVFGSNGHVEKPVKKQVEAFTRRSLKTLPINTHIKSIVQPKYVKGLPRDPHHFPFKKGKFCVNENFEQINGPMIRHTSSKIQLNHYYLRSLEDYKEKMIRGRADMAVSERKLEFFYEVDKVANMVADESALELQLLWAQDGEIPTKA